MGMNDKHNYDPTKWVDNSEPDIDAEHLNKIESALQEYGVSIDELAAAGGTAAKVKATDTYGMVVEALGESTAQALIDAIANKVMNELINKNKIVNNLLATDASTVLAGTQGAALDKRLVAAENAVTKLNSDLKNTISSNETVINPNIAKSVLTVFNGWDSNAANYNSFFKNKLSILITVWVWNNTIGNLEAERAQCMIHSSKIMYRYYDYNHNWSEWG
mgnify:CR=1 FL=1